MSTTEFARSTASLPESINIWILYPSVSGCANLKPTFEKLSEEYRKENSDVQLYTMDVELNKEFVSSLGVRAVPTVKSFSGGREVFSQPGLQMEGQIKQLVSDLING